MHQFSRLYAVIALSILGSATLLFSCNKSTEITQYDFETLLTESSENRTITMMENGQRSYTFTTPLMEGYSMATNPYQEFRRGIHMTTFTQDSLGLEDANITANYAIYYENQKLWEAKGNVVIIKNNREKGDTTVKNHTEIYTQQLFWNATTKKIYSNVDTKILQADGWHFGVGFDADEDLKNIHFRKYSSEMEFDMSQPTPEEIEAENKRKEEAENKNKSKEKGGKSSSNNKPSTNNTVTNGNKRPSSANTVTPNSSRPSTDNRALTPSTIRKNGDKPATKGSTNDKPKAQMPTQRPLNNTNLEISSSIKSDFSANINDGAPTTPPPVAKKR